MTTDKMIQQRQVRKINLGVFELQFNLHGQVCPEYVTLSELQLWVSQYVDACAKEHLKTVAKRKFLPFASYSYSVTNRGTIYPHLEVTVFGHRLETAREHANRIKRHKASQARKKKKTNSLRRKELKLLAELKAKYPEEA